ncbi:MAG TPA: ribosome biogenesis GTPase YlqF [Candidatus Cybelea sp.]|nr:ribosome biogenesis GTPase YlqF [Candidatus Cybelea sp.]
MNTKLERHVQWFPGHMAKALRRIREYLRAIDVVIEVVDARIARSGRNPILDELAAERTRIVALDRDDLASPASTKLWLRDFSLRGYAAVAVDGRNPRSVARIAAAIAPAPGRRKGPGGVSRAMIVGIPNSGKSTIVNALLRRGAAKTEARAGVTRQVQWFRLSPAIELMDTPGVLPPRISTAAAQWRLAICGAVPSDHYDAQEVVAEFHAWLLASHPRTTVPDLHAFATTRGFVRRGGELDYHNAAYSYIRAFNEGVFGRISLETAGDSERT